MGDKFYRDASYLSMTRLAQFVMLGREAYLILLTITFFFLTNTSKAQEYFLPLSNEMNLKYEPFLQRVTLENVHTSVKPWLSKDLMANTPFDSLSNPVLKDKKFNKTLIGRKLFKEHLIQVNDDDVVLHLDHVFEYSGGREQGTVDKNIYTNQRGVWIGGTFGKRFSFDATFYENLAMFPSYVDSFVKKTSVAPGQGRVKKATDSYDFAMSTGTISYALRKHFTFQAGQDRNFIGDGYRSLLLSDNSTPYPFLKIITDFWHIRYVNLYTVMQDLENGNGADAHPFRRKYGSFHYLDLNIGKHVTFGVMEAVIWHADSASGARGYDINYLNPFIFFRPVEYNIGSPDNVLLGINGKLKINSRNILYAQLMLDEFVLRHVVKGDGWWANKHGLQGGFKSYNLFGIKNFHFQTEFNYVRPYTYQHRETLGNYAHFRQPLAHPLGANFWESVNFIYYSWKKVDVVARLSYATFGTDTGGVNFGQNVYLSYNEHYQEFNNTVGQGLENTLIIANLKIGYVINPVTALRVFVDVTARQQKNIFQTKNALVFQGGIKTHLFNRYYDF